MFGASDSSPSCWPFYSFECRHAMQRRFAKIRFSASIASRAAVETMAGIIPFREANHATPHPRFLFAARQRAAVPGPGREAEAEHADAEGNRRRLDSAL